MEPEHSGTIKNLFIELKKDFASFRREIYNKVDGFSKLLSPSTVDIQSDEPLSPVAPILQQEILEAEVKSKASTLGSSTTVNDITDYLGSLKLQYLQFNRFKTKFQSYASFHIEVHECDLQLISDASSSPEDYLITKFYGKLRKYQISQAVTSESIINNLSESNSTTPTVSKRLSSFYQNVHGLRTKTSDFFRSVASDDQDVILITETWLCEDIDSLDLFDDRYLVFRRDRGSSSN
ncbi:hypothetical protein AVEN_215598-1 [Araneus ventricosus]|uniref:Uncharacterized protein n=1 Tax=Araneus ventricosus TaxID=182803 RepID=A0A4Y2MLL6_ARAVE|nr:hypothetical protein AVEN_215598-1 [Araneus ventricosus]